MEINANTTNPVSVPAPAPINITSEINRIFFTPLTLVILFVLVIFYIIYSNSLGNSKELVLGNNSESSNSVVIQIVIGIIGLIILAYLLKYIMSISVTTSVNDSNTDTPTLNVAIDHTTNNNSTLDVNGKQVFNIPGNYYNYTNAKALCQAYDSELATYDQVESAYNKGAEWCNYGWSDGQMALFPTQKTTFNNLQKIKGHENDCGRPGINGGYIANPQINFGVNCYGVKPNITQTESNLMKTMKPYPETANDILFQNQVDYWKDKINNILISPFNSNSWMQV
jgi:hypothetical protein